MKKIHFLFITLIAKTATADCFDSAGKYYQIDPDYLRAIAWQESKFNPNAKNKNKDGSFDLGIMQINTKTFKSIKKEYPTLTENNLLINPCLNIHLGAMILNRNFAAYGKHWLAIGMYNAGMRNANSTIENRYHYAQKVYNHYKKIKSGKIKKSSVINLADSRSNQINKDN
ncbi:lytic transglycosylase domain-containing protein (plasmid) [Arsenophonus sp. aPb]|uniref:lytic transglycosylase domain-containing protein n=1 Tax=Arsenophonus sp. aPb TaxID=3041619 RepID=UPI0024694BFA|nr:lytic transglycosylase domain-containing protein [Arsenophonus sp. aPb]WGL99919.1 lytic transglycosylase domain-containing protein [Arsenophonus sp. aPb]